MAEVNIKIYKWEGKFFPFEIKSDCGECNISTRIIKDVAREFQEDVEIEEIPWLSYWYKVIFRGGWHAPIVLVNGKIISQGIVVDRDLLRSKIISEIYKNFKIDNENHIFTLPDCRHCKMAKEILNKKSIKFKEHDVLKSNKDMQKMLSLVLGKVHPITLPQIFLNGNWIGGASDLKKLNEENKLEKLLK